MQALRHITTLHPHKSWVNSKSANAHNVQRRIHVFLTLSLVTVSPSPTSLKQHWIYRRYCSEEAPMTTGIRIDLYFKILFERNAWRFRIWHETQREIFISEVKWLKTYLEPMDRNTSWWYVHTAFNEDTTILLIPWNIPVPHQLVSWVDHHTGRTARQELQIL